MITTLHKWFPMVDATGHPDRLDASNKRMERIQQEYDIALKFKKAKDKVDELEVELYNKKAEQQKINLEIFQNRRIDIEV